MIVGNKMVWTAVGLKCNKKFLACVAKLEALRNLITIGTWRLKYFAKAREYLAKSGLLTTT